MAEEIYTKPDRHLVLVGASIGKEWHLEELGKRIQAPGYRFSYVGTYDFDKGDLIDGLIKDVDKPDIVLIKECSSYFPGDLYSYERKISGWVDMLKTAGIRPILVTTAPVGKPDDYIVRLKNVVKIIIGRPTKQGSVAEFNDWMKEYGRRIGIPVFDLESILILSPEERWLRPEYDSGDKTHLTARAYEAMDRAFARFLPNLDKAPDK